MSVVFTCWKEIAEYLGKGVRTVQRWEHELGLPVRRPEPHDKNVVIALPEEIDAWLRSRYRSTVSGVRLAVQKSATEPGGTTAVPFAPFTILAVDDNEAQHYALRRCLQQAGFRVISAFNGTETLSRARHDPDAIVLDVHLPDVDGYEVCRRLRQEPETADIPVIFLTAVSRDEEALARGRAAGGTAFLFAPVDPPTLVTVLRGVLARRVPQRQAPPTPTSDS